MWNTISRIPALLVVLTCLCGCDSTEVGGNPDPPQTYWSIYGTVTSEMDGTPIEDVDVQLWGGGYCEGGPFCSVGPHLYSSTTSNSQGWYYLSVSSCGSYYWLEKPGYEFLKVEVRSGYGVPSPNCIKGEHMTIDFVMKPIPVE